MHRFINFKNFSHAEGAGLNLFSHVTLLVGKNGSGKTNAIEAVEVLSYLANGLPVHRIADYGRGDARYEVRGGLQSCPSNGHKSFTLGFDQAGINFDGQRQPCEYWITVSIEPRPHISAERLIVGDRILFSAEATDKNITNVTYDNFARGGTNPRQQYSAEQSILSQYEALISHLSDRKQGQKRRREALNVVKAISYYLQSSFVFDPNPKLMRAYERIHQDRLLKDGSNISAVLFSLVEGDEEEKKSAERIIKWIRQVPEEPFNEFNFVTTTQGDVLFGFTIDGEPGLVDARLISDGTLRTLAVLTAMETAERNSRIIIEEFDNGLHPSRSGILVSALWEVAERKNLNVLVTTHNPAILNSLTLEQMDSVVLCHRGKQTGSSRLTRLCDLDGFDELSERGQLGDLISKRVVDEYLFPNISAKGKKKIAHEWFASLRDSS